MLATFNLRKKAPDSKFRTIPAPQIFKVACKDVLFPGTTLQRGGPTASALQATLNTWGKGAGGFFFAEPGTRLELVSFLQRCTRARYGWVGALAIRRTDAETTKTCESHRWRWR